MGPAVLFACATPRSQNYNRTTHRNGALLPPVGLGVIWLKPDLSLKKTRIAWCDLRLGPCQSGSDDQMFGGMASTQPSLPSCGLSMVS
jgi:hypothetical protein